MSKLYIYSKLIIRSLFRSGDELLLKLKIKNVPLWDP